MCQLHISGWRWGGAVSISHGLAYDTIILIFEGDQDKHGAMQLFGSGSWGKQRGPTKKVG